MRKLTIMNHISLDGVVEIGTPNSDFPYGDWTAPYRTPEGFKLVMDTYGERFDLVLGRRTYDQWSGFWPNVPNNPMADRLNAATKHVVTHHPETLQWGPHKALSSNFVEEIRALKGTDGPKLMLAGSSTLTSALLEHGLADDLILIVDPVFLVTGKRLFAEGTPARAFTLVHSQPLPSGIVLNHYTAAGPLQNMK